MIDSKKSFEGGAGKGKFWKKKWFKITLAILVVLVVIGGAVAWKTGGLINRISTNGNILGTLGHLVPGVQDQLKGKRKDESMCCFWVCAARMIRPAVIWPTASWLSASKKMTIRFP